MTVRRFRSADEARSALWARREDPRLFERIAALWARSSRLAPPWRAEGIRKFRTIEEANAHRSRAVARRARQLRAAK